MRYALNDTLALFVFIYCIIVWKCMLKCVIRVRIKRYIYKYIFTITYCQMYSLCVTQLMFTWNRLPNCDHHSSAISNASHYMLFQ